jgi:purine catabolism regulator
MLTVRELLADLQIEPLTGETTLDAPLRWVHISELTDPSPWLSGGELLLTTGMALDTEDAQRAYVGQLADHGIAGLGVGTGFVHTEVPPALLDAARERDLVVFEVPYDTPFIAITEQAFSRLVNEQYALLQRSIAAQERLQRIVLGERGLDAIAAALSTLIGGAALVFEGRGEPAAQRTFRRELSGEAADALSTELHERARRGDGRGFAPTHAEVAGRALALPISGDETSRGGLPQAWLVGVKDSGGLTEFDRLILHQAVTVVAFELLRRRVADTTERRLAGDVLSGIVAGELTGAELTRRLEPFGLGTRVSALVVAGDGTPATRPAALEAPLADALRAEAIDGLVASHGQHICALIPGVDDDELFELADRVVATLAHGTEGTLTAGVGRAATASRTRESYHEARCALEARSLGVDDTAPAAANGNGSNGSSGTGHAPTRVATYRDLGSFQLLLSLQDSDALRLFCESLLSPIEQGEGHYGGELLRSLEAFIEENGQWERAARRLYCHRHTLRYRIRKIEELTGRDLSSARNRIEFWLALRGREIVSTPTSARNTA